MTRRSKRELERSLADLDGGKEYPEASIAEILSYDWEPVDEERRLYRAENDNRVYWWNPELNESLREGSE